VLLSGVIISAAQAQGRDETVIAEMSEKKEDGERVLEIGKFYPSLEGGINLTQSAYSDNWVGGDKGSIVWTAILNGLLENQLSEKVNWWNQLKLAFGQTHTQDVDANEPRTRFWEKPEKSTDLIDYETIFRFTLDGPLDPFVAGRFESQFQDASDPLGRNLVLNPLRFKEGVGVARKFIDEEERQLLSRLGFSLRQGVRRIFVSSTDPMNTDTETESETDGGIEWVTDYKTRILEDRVSWTSKLTVYQPVFYSGKSDLEDVAEDALRDVGLDPDVADFTTEIEFDFENIFTTQITKLISVNLYTRWLYDKYDNSVVPSVNDDGTIDEDGAASIRGAIRKSGQFKQTLSIGVTYRFL
jgi:hypothetical protein